MCLKLALINEALIKKALIKEALIKVASTEVASVYGASSDAPYNVRSSAAAHVSPVAKVSSNLASSLSQPV